MKAEFKIDNLGNLWTKRNRKSWKPQFCPYESETNCGDNCALFGEPEEMAQDDWILELCKTVIRGTYTEERE